jgi:FixJ family two-component response regulator
VLLELDLPGMSGLDPLKLVLDRREMPFVFLSGRADIRTTVQLMKAGAFEFLSKPIAPEAVLEAVRAALARSDDVLRHFAQVRFLQERYESLSRREREVMKLLVGGCLNKQVGGELGISEITVKAHRGKMMRKMQAASFAELVRMDVSLRGTEHPDAMEFDAPISFQKSERYQRARASYALV